MEDVHVTFVHGLANKPRPDELRRIWLDALRTPFDGDDGFDLGASGVGDSFVYWADLFYDAPVPAAEYESVPDELSESIKGGTNQVPDNEWTKAMLQYYPDTDIEYFEPQIAKDLSSYERIPLPSFLKKAIMAEYLREAHDYLFNVNGIRDIIRSRVIADLKKQPDGTKRILVGHSQGTFIIYDVMTAIKECPVIDGFITFGSPLGIDEV